MTSHLVPLRDEWALWRDLAVRSAGFPVSGLDVFGPGDEPARLRAVAADPRFREAVAWQNRAALRNAVDKVASGSPAPGSRQRQREEVVASYWQRYCSKNDTIGFFGPLAWGSMVDDGGALVAAWDDALADRSVHFEAWCFEVLAEALDLPVRVPLGPHPEHDVRAQLERLADEGTRQRGLDALDRLETCRDAIATARPDGLEAALDALDREFEALTRHASTRRPGVMYGARTLVYLDCLRGLRVEVGPVLRDELAMTLPAVLAGSRWFCGQVHAAVCGLIDEVIERVGDGPLGPVLGQTLPAILAVPPVVAEINAELQARWAMLLADPDVTTLVDRADAVFAGHVPGWSWSVYQSPDIQVAAASMAAIEAGDFLCVVGDFHPGANPLGQGMFATRHPDRERFLEAVESDVGAGVFLIPPRTAERMTSRVMVAVTRPHWTHVASAPEDCMPEGYRTVGVGDLVIEGGVVKTRDGSVTTTVAELLNLPIFLAGVRTYNPFPVEDHSSRLTLSRTVLRRETWQVRAGEAPTSPDELIRWAGDAQLPRRVFVLSPLEAKPIYVDLESDALARVACRMLRRAAREVPDGIVRITEMLPLPEDCWLEDPDGNRYTSELRIVAVDVSRRAAAAEA